MKKKLMSIFLIIFCISNLLSCNQKIEKVAIKEEVVKNKVKAEEFIQNFKREGENEVNSLFFEENFKILEESDKIVYQNTYKRNYAGEFEVEVNGYYLDENLKEPIYIILTFNNMTQSNLKYTPVVMLFLTDDYSSYIHHSFYIGALNQEVDNNTKEKLKELGFKEGEHNFAKRETIILFESNE